MKISQRFFGWLWQGGAAAESRKQVAAKSKRRLALEREAATSVEVADRALHPVTPLRSGSGSAVAASLYARAIGDLRRALSEDAVLSSDDALTQELARRLPSNVQVEGILDLETLPDEPPLGDDRVVSLAQAAHALLDIARTAERNVQRALRRRMVRVSSLIFALVALGVTGASLGPTLLAGPDLALGKPWRASSAYAGFSAQSGLCDGKRTRIFFHTNRENEPWVEIDLGAVTRIHRVDVQNRRDCCRDRAFPLALEGSLDGQQWKELARRTEPFSKWIARFDPVEVRYVRVKALKRTFLHLESVAVR